MANQQIATLRTNHGDIRVELFANHAPKTVRNFVGLSDGTLEWTDPKTGKPGKVRCTPGGVPPHHPGFMIQGETRWVPAPAAGYRFADEIHPELQFDRPYLLAMANAGPNTNGSQFFITVAPTAWLNTKHHLRRGRRPTQPGCGRCDRRGPDRPRRPPRAGRDHRGHRRGRGRQLSSDQAAGGSTAAPPHCAWHPERETYIACSRCDRPICPDCMTAARSASSAPTVQRALRSPSRPNAHIPGSPAGVLGIIAVCAVVFVLQFALGSDQVITYFGMWPVAIASRTASGTGWSPRFSLHAGILHIAFNMYVLLVLGPPLERALAICGSWCSSCLPDWAGRSPSFAFSAPTTISVGASGAIFGIMGALVVAGRRLRWDITQVVVLIAINIVIGFVFGSGIDWRAHLGGLVTGAAVAALMVLPAHDTRRGYVEVGGVVVVLALLVAGAVLRAGQLALVG